MRSGRCRAVARCASTGASTVSAASCTRSNVSRTAAEPMSREPTSCASTGRTSSAASSRKLGSWSSDGTDRWPETASRRPPRRSCSWRWCLSTAGRRAQLSGWERGTAPCQLYLWMVTLGLREESDTRDQPEGLAEVVEGELAPQHADAVALRAELAVGLAAVNRPPAPVVGPVLDVGASCAVRPLGFRHNSDSGYWSGPGVRTTDPEATASGRERKSGSTTVETGAGSGKRAGDAPLGSAR